MFWRYMVLGLFVASQLSAESPTAKASWRWSDEERVARRVDPADIHERLVAHRARAATGGGRAITTSAFDSVKFVIDGARNPELFMPWELMERFLNSTDPGNPAGEMMRQRYTDDIIAAGWNVESFWTDLEAVTEEYGAVREEIYLDQEQSDDLRTEPATQRRNPLVAAHDMRKRFCHARSEALRAARKRFGSEELDRFLYEAVAPAVTVFSDEPMTAPQLLHIAEGCR